MQAKDVMTSRVVSVTPNATVREIVALMLARRISAVPVLEGDGKLVGIVSEGDLVRRPESGTERQPSWWLSLLGGGEQTALEYAKSHGKRAADVMTRAVVAVDESTELSAIATLLEKHHVKRVPVVRDGQVVGIVSRANLLQGLAACQPTPPTNTDDEGIREQVLDEVRRAGVDTVFVNAVVNDDTVQLWGGVTSVAQRDAARIAAQAIAGERAVDNNLAVFPPMLQAAMGGE